MKKHLSFAFLTFALTLSILSGCQPKSVVYRPGTTKANPGNLPPGQAKKLYGTQSARSFAPGQQKKQGAIMVSQGKTTGNGDGNGNGKNKKGKKKK